MKATAILTALVMLGVAGCEDDDADRDAGRGASGSGSMLRDAGKRDATAIPSPDSGQTDAGSCGTCWSGTCCDGKCTSLFNDFRNCGKCGRQCPHETPYCEGKLCTLPACFASCDGGTCCGEVCCSAGEHCCSEFVISRN